MKPDFDERVTDLQHFCDDGYLNSTTIHQKADELFPDADELPDVIRLLRPGEQRLGDELRVDPTWETGRDKLKRLQALIAHLEGRVAQPEPEPLRRRIKA